MSYNLANVLIIEDNEEDFEMISHGLKRCGLKAYIKHCQRSKDVRALLSDAADEIAFIFLDLNLPGESGIELIKAFKAHTKYRLTPIAVLSTSNNPRDIEESYAAGANTYHVKPLETPVFHDLVERIAKYWSRDAKTVSMPV